jgi:hypothetical protein
MRRTARATQPQERAPMTQTRRRTAAMTRTTMTR